MFRSRTFSLCVRGRCAYVAGQRSVRHIEEGIWTGRGACTGAQKNSGASFIDGIVGYRIVVAAATTIIHVNTRFGAAINGVRSHRV